jgi:two-component system chemotaxis response regulator CheB
MKTDPRDLPRRGTIGRFAVVAFASSAGGIQALTTVLRGLPADFAVPVLVVQHLDPRHDTVLADLLNLRTALQVALATDGEPLGPGTVRLAPPDRHLLIGADNRLVLDDGPPVNYVRPSADRLFTSAAAAYGAAVLACVLTGSGRDGAAGARAVKDAGGAVLAQDPADAAFPSMPRAAIATGAVDETPLLEAVSARVQARVAEAVAS